MFFIEKVCLFVFYIVCLYFIEKAAMGVPVSRIIEEARSKSNKGDSPALTRLQLIDRRDVLNVMGAGKISDAASVRNLVQTIKQTNKQVSV